MNYSSIPAPYKKITPGYMLLIIVSTFAFSFIYYGIALVFNDNPMIMFDYVVFTCVLAVVVTGGYQIFFWVQNNNYFFHLHSTFQTPPNHNLYLLFLSLNILVFIRYL